jgi:peptide-methionine (S)-S-oxide reductase
MKLEPATFPQPPYQPEEAGEQAVVLAGGCFWCTEGVFERIPGVRDVESGYAGDSPELAKYDLVCSGRNRHAEAIRITYDADQVSLGEILRIFFAVAHDPTQVDRQGNDVGPQYRSAVFFANDEQRRAAAEYIATLDAAGVFPGPIATTLEALADTGFYPAEAYHQDYMQANPQQPYVCAVGLPKVRKLDAWLAASAG